MTDRPQAIRGYRFRPEDELFLDTNIWLYIFGPQKPTHQRVAVYSEAFKHILATGCPVYIDALVVSEFVNAFARLQWKQIAPDVKHFKEFRKRDAFKPIAKTIALETKKILKYCSRIESGFEALDINGLIQEYASGNADFNDQVIAALCHRKGLILVTDDGDFRRQGIPVLTANQRLLG